MLADTRSTLRGVLRDFSISWPARAAVIAAGILLLAALALWRLSNLEEAGNEFARTRLEAVINSVAISADDWVGDQLVLATAIGRIASRAGLWDYQKGEAPALAVNELNSALSDLSRAGELRGIALLSRSGDTIAQVGSMMGITSDTKTSGVDGAGAGYTVGDASLSASGSVLLPIARDLCSVSPRSGVPCGTVVLVFDIEKRLLTSLLGVRGAGRTGRTAIRVAPNIFFQSPLVHGHETAWSVVRDTSLLGGRLIAGTASAPLYERKAADGKVMVGVRRGVSRTNWTLVREGERPEVMAQYTRQARLETLLTGVVVLLVMLGYMIAERTAGARRLRQINEAETRLAAVVRTTSDAVLIAVLAGGELRIDAANAAAARLLALQPEEMLGRAIYDFLDKRSGRECRQIAHTLEKMSAPTCQEVEANLTVIAADGRRVLCEASICSVSTRARRDFTFIVRDVSVRRDLEARLAEAAKLTAVGQLVSGIAHELNTPLTTVMLLAEMTMVSDVPEGARDDLRVIHQQADRARRIVQDLLSSVRVAPAENELIDITLAVADVARALQPQLAELGATLNVNVSDGTAEARGDASAIQQILSNLVINGAQAAGRDGRVDIFEDHDWEYVRLRVTDSGPGVPANVRNRVFEPFFSTKPVGKGTGLGLSVSLGIAEQHGGNLELEPEQAGQGASFLLTLPRVTSRASS